MNQQVKDILLEAIRSAMAELSELEKQEDWFVSPALPKLEEAEQLLLQEETK